MNAAWQQYIVEGHGRCAVYWYSPVREAWVWTNFNGLRLTCRDQLDAMACAMDYVVTGDIPGDVRSIT